MDVVLVLLLFRLTRSWSVEAGQISAQLRSRIHTCRGSTMYAIGEGYPVRSLGGEANTWLNLRILTYPRTLPVMAHPGFR